METKKCTSRSFENVFLIPRSPSIETIETCNVHRLTFICMKHRKHSSCKACAAPRRRPVSASDTEIMFKNDSPVQLQLLECDRRQQQLESPVPHRCVTTRIIRSQASNIGRRLGLLTATYLCVCLST